jgi:hypothetical protein
LQRLFEPTSLLFAYFAAPVRLPREFGEVFGHLVELLGEPQPVVPDELVGVEKCLIRSYKGPV